jgi:hypothetical protein
MPSTGHPTSSFSCSIVKLEGERVEGTGQPEISLQRRVERYTARGNPKEIANAPILSILA